MNIFQFFRPPNAQQQSNPSHPSSGLLESAKIEALIETAVALVPDQLIKPLTASTNGRAQAASSNLHELEQGLALNVLKYLRMEVPTLSLTNSPQIAAGIGKGVKIIAQAVGAASGEQLSPARVRSEYYQQIQDFCARLSGDDRALLERLHFKLTPDVTVDSGADSQALRIVMAIINLKLEGQAVTRQSLINKLT